MSKEPTPPMKKQPVLGQQRSVPLEETTQQETAPAPARATRALSRKALLVMGGGALLVVSVLIIGQSFSTSAAPQRVATEKKAPPTKTQAHTEALAREIEELKRQRTVPQKNVGVEAGGRRAGQQGSVGSGSSLASSASSTSLVTPEERAAQQQLARDKGELDRMFLGQAGGGAVGGAPRQDPWSQARQQYRQQQATQYYQQMGAARRARLFFPGGRPTEGTAEKQVGPGRGARQDQGRFLQQIETTRAHQLAQHRAAARKNPLATTLSTQDQQELFMRRGARAQTQGDRDPLVLGRAAYAPGDVVSAGTMVLAVLETGVNSQLPGAVIARVARPVWDARAERVLIPAGSKLLGLYNARVAKTQTHLQLVWTALIFPDQRRLALPNIPAVRVSGQTGVPGVVDHHFDKVLTGAALSAVFAAASGSLSGPVNTLQADPSSLAVQRGGGSLVRAGESFARPFLNAPPTIQLQPGLILGMIVLGDLTIPPKRNADDFE